MYFKHMDCLFQSKCLRRLKASIPSNHLFFLYKTLPLTITNITKELAKSVRPFKRDDVTKGNKDLFIYRDIVRVYR